MIWFCSLLTLRTTEQLCRKTFALWCPGIPGMYHRNWVDDTGRRNSSQSYPSDLGTPGNGVTISVSSSYNQGRHSIDNLQNINFSGGLTKVTTESSAYMIAVNCGQGSCTGELCFLLNRVTNINLRHLAQGTWDWSSLTTSGGQIGTITNNNLITGFKQWLGWI